MRREVLVPGWGLFLFSLERTVWEWLSSRDREEIITNVCWLVVKGCICLESLYSVVTQNKGKWWKTVDLDYRFVF